MTSTATRTRGFGHFLKYHLPALLYAAAVITVSSIPNLRTPEVRTVALDKLVHFLEYALFAYLTFRSFAHLSRGISATRAYLFTVLFVSFFAAFDEYFQSFIPGRHMDPWDLTMDVLGSVLVATFFWLRRRRLNANSAARSGQFGP